MTLLPRSPRLTGASTTDRGLPNATVARLPLYLRALTQLRATGSATCSSDQLAEATGVSSANVRKDLSHLGSHGTRGVGYDVAHLQAEIAQAIGQTQEWNVVLVGAGHLGKALAAYPGFASRGSRIVAVVDADPKRLGEQVVDGLVIESADDLDEIVRDRAVSIAILATPTHAAQDVADRLVAAGVTSILNFAPVALRVPDGVDVRQVDVAAELQILAYHEQRKSSPREEAVSG
ncbi:redox-sensing transcriptional repressor Rex [Aeromicrobium camelliae]|uniref:redox-sensing transcriptional repressor Rex n=1 Tax=Aeromicrobium camelliae TaxID=1538144 RepID=UPI001FB84E82|nr:redox-sensing transcriptional repressor Rex [Aeromicrobium camelliae]